uniref:Uncharacterized protein n=1 Tax=Kalanchoe fedtschenkoi TaxID=63787 RepID=A0A7N0UKE6_KALFE
MPPPERQPPKSASLLSTAQYNSSRSIESTSINLNPTLRRAFTPDPNASLMLDQVNLAVLRSGHFSLQRT